MPSAANFDTTFNNAFQRAERVFCRVNNLSAYHESYKPLTRQLWIKQDPEQTGTFTSLDQCHKFCDDMVKNNWSDWNWADCARERAIWEAHLAMGGRISIVDFLLASEDPEYPMPTPAVITRAHTEWKQQGGENPGKPTQGQASFKVIDFAEPNRDKLAKEIVSALKADGFFCAINHGVPQELISHTLWMAQEFFARTRKAKAEEIQKIRIEESLRPQMKTCVGYAPIGIESLNPTQGPDLKETFDYSLPSKNNKNKEDDASATNRSACCMSRMKNLWPAENDNSNPTSFTKQKNRSYNVEPLAPNGFRKTCEEYLDKSYAFSRELLSLICKGLDLSPAVIEKEIMSKFEDPLVVNRLIRYPADGNRQQRPSQPPMVPPNFGGFPAPPPPQQQQHFGCGSHIDYGATTVIFENSSGIEVQRRGDPDAPYQAVNHIPGAAIVNTGYVLEKLTNGALPATRHRVQNLHATDRFSLALFLDPNPESKIGPLKEMLQEGVPAKYTECEAGTKGVRFGNASYLKMAADRA